MRGNVRVIITVVLGLLSYGKFEGRPARAQQASSPFSTSVAENCRTDLWNVNHITGWQVQWPASAQRLPVGTPDEQHAALGRWATLPTVIDQEIETLRKGLREGFAAPRPIVRRVSNQLAALLALSPEKSPLWSPARRTTDTRFQNQWDDLMNGQVLPAVRRFQAFLRDEYREVAREDVGLSALPGGRRCYRDLVERWTTLDVSPEEMREIGTRYMKHLAQELATWAEQHRGGLSVDSLLDRFRHNVLADPFSTERDIIEQAEGAIARADAALPSWFTMLPRAEVVVRPIPEHSASEAPSGFYRPSSGTGQPGTYFVNTTRPEDRRLMAEAIAFHEAVPGHHLQLAIAREQGPARQPYNAGFVEGWALYAERLADEMGLYSSEQDRAGMLVKHMWATSRLLVDPGIHLFGWSRHEAIEYMRAHTALSVEEIEVEVDRYIALPGQSLAYILGYLEFRRLRDHAEQALEGRFDIQAFHAIVLQNGIVPLPELASTVERWIDSVK